MITIARCILVFMFCRVLGVAQQERSREAIFGKGIALEYPGDAGIASDPRVIFVENFEEESLQALWGRWETITARSGMSFSREIELRPVDLSTKVELGQRERGLVACEILRAQRRRVESQEILRRLHA